MTAQTLTPAQTAAALGVASSTLRRWSTAFARHLSPAANPPKGRKRSYTADDLGVLRRAADLIRAGRTPEEAVALLGVAVDPAGLTGLEVATLPALARDLADARDGIRQLADAVRKAQEETTATKAQLGDAQARIDALEARLTAWEGLSWVDRLLGRRPKP